MNATPQTVSVNSRTYAWPKRPVIVVCIDGSEPAYIDRAAAAGRMPHVARAIENGTHRVAKCVMPSVANPNDLSIITGAPPSVHGICGNFFYDNERSEEVMMNDPKYLRGESILAKLSAAGAKVMAIT